MMLRSLSPFGRCGALGVRGIALKTHGSKRLHTLFAHCLKIEGTECVYSVPRFLDAITACSLQQLRQRVLAHELPSMLQTVRPLQSFQLFVVQILFGFCSVPLFLPSGSFRLVLLLYFYSTGWFSKVQPLHKVFQHRR